MREIFIADGEAGATIVRSDSSKEIEDGKNEEMACGKMEDGSSEEFYASQKKKDATGRVGLEARLWNRVPTPYSVPSTIALRIKYTVIRIASRIENRSLLPYGY
jgi:hypothetical protein